MCQFKEQGRPSFRGFTFFNGEKISSFLDALVFLQLQNECIGTVKAKYFNLKVLLFKITPVILKVDSRCIHKKERKKMLTIFCYTLSIIEKKQERRNFFYLGNISLLYFVL